MDIKIKFIGIITGILNGLFGSGGGTIIVPALEKYLGLETKKSHATAIAVILPLSIISLIVYIKNIRVDLSTVILVSIGGIIGGYIGATLLQRLSGKWIHYIFGSFMLASAIRLLI